jgi:hypothetical protein
VIPRGFTGEEPPDCRSNVRRGAFLPKQKSLATSILPIVDSQTVDLPGIWCAILPAKHPMLPPGGA